MHRILTVLFVFVALLSVVSPATAQNIRIGGSSFEAPGSDGKGIRGEAEWKNLEVVGFYGGLNKVEGNGTMWSTNLLGKYRWGKVEAAGGVHYGEDEFGDFRQSSFRPLACARGYISEDSRYNGDVRFGGCYHFRDDAEERLEGWTLDLRVEIYEVSAMIEFGQFDGINIDSENLVRVTFSWWPKKGRWVGHRRLDGDWRN